MCREPKTTPAGLWQRLAEDFLALQVVMLVGTVFVELRNLLAFATLAAVLMLLTFAVYPFQPQYLLMYFSWVVLVSVVLVGLYVTVRAERDEMLSRIARTEPNKIAFDRGFVSQAVTYVALPLLMLIATYFPALDRFLGQIAQVVK